MSTSTRHRDFSLNFGYDADIVTGATPRTYGGAPDAVSAATPFSDNRHAFHGGAELRLGPTAVAAGYTFGFENDYRSHAHRRRRARSTCGARTPPSASATRTTSTACATSTTRAPCRLERRALSYLDGCFNKTAVGLTDEALAIDSYAASWTQVLTPILLSDVSVGFQVLDGFQSNPYRRVRLFNGTVEAQESEPLSAPARRRAGRAAPGGRARARRPSASWGASTRHLGRQVGHRRAHLGEYVDPQLLLRVRGRFYQQSRAVFYRDAGETLSYESVGPVGQYFTGDRELSPFRDYLAGFKMPGSQAPTRTARWALFEPLDLNVKVGLHPLRAADAAAAQPGAQRRAGQRAHRRIGPRAALVAQVAPEPAPTSGGDPGGHKPRSHQ